MGILSEVSELMIRSASCPFIGSTREATTFPNKLLPTLLLGSHTNAISGCFSLRYKKNCRRISIHANYHSVKSIKLRNLQSSSIMAMSSKIITSSVITVLVALQAANCMPTDAAKCTSSLSINVALYNGFIVLEELSVSMHVL